MSMCFTFGLGLFWPMGGQFGGFVYDTTGGVICITMAVTLWCNGRSERNVVRVWWPAMRGARPPRLLFSCLAARPKQPPGLVVQEKQSYIARFLE